MSPLHHRLLHRFVRVLGGFVADWKDIVVLHFELPPTAIASRVPVELDTRGERAFVSLLSFRLERMRPAGVRPAALGRILMRPFSDHLFLNLRTYVRGPAGPGILFLAEWVDNPRSAPLGPRTYGLPYRLAKMERRNMRAAGLRHIAVHDRATNATANLVVPLKPDRPPREVQPGSLDAFLLERYVAYTRCGSDIRAFKVAHPRWQAAPFALARTNTRMFENVMPWFREATFIGGHHCEGFIDVLMGPPHASAEKITVAAEAGSDAPAPIGTVPDPAQ